ncbi:MAG: glycosyltransferase [Candidatus Nanoarchaeia archaeon]|nr:glycosyltransferase [Candidatus Nanoarchaeia archaeon]
MKFYFNEAQKRGYNVSWNKIDDKQDFYIIGMFYKSHEDELKKYIKERKYIYIEHSIETILPEKPWIRNFLIPHSYRNFLFSQRQYQHLYNALPRKNKYLLESNIDYLVVPVDYNFWQPVESIQRENNLYIFVGMIHSNKGVNEILEIAENNPRNKYIFIGTAEGGDIDVDIFKQYTNIEYVGHKTPEQLREYYSRAQGCYLLPTGGAVESAGRVVFEATLCGCEPIINNDVGNKGWPFYKDRKKLIMGIKDSVDDFFHIIKKGISGG